METTSKIINGNLYEYDSNGNLIHYKISTGFESWYDYDSNGKLIHVRSYNGFESWYDSDGNRITKKEFDELNSSCDGKIAIIDGKNYQLKLV